MTQIRIRDGVFFRHYEDESVFWNLRTYGCQIVRNAEAFVQPLTTEWQSLDSVVAKVADMFKMAPAEIRQDAFDFYDNLAQSTFVDITGITEDMQDGNRKRVINHSVTKAEDGNKLVLGDFYTKYGLPSDFHIDLTNGCTERCVHCYIPDYTPHYLPLELGKKALREFREAQGMTVVFSGGECMMHPAFDTLLRYARSLNLNIIILSNLTLCNADKVKLLQDVGPQFVNVSLYSMDAAVHDSITRLPGSWKKTMAAIRALRQAGVAIRIASPLMRQNRDSFEELKMFATSIQGHLVSGCDIFGKMNHDCSNQDCALNEEELECALRRYRPLFAKEPYPAEALSPESKVCEIGQGRINLDAGGSYYPCDGCHGLSLGEARDKTLLEVWDGPELNALRALKNRDFGECAVCANRRWCKVCPTRNFNETGNILKHSLVRCRLARVIRKVYGRE